MTLHTSRKMAGLIAETREYFRLLSCTQMLRFQSNDLPLGIGSNIFTPAIQV